jgi:hypothetical protein
MKHAKLTLAAKAIALVFACGLHGTASAAIVEGVSLGAWEFVESFNSMNNGQGYLFDIKKVGTSHYKLYNRGRESPDISDYPQDVYGGFTTFQAARNSTFNTYFGTAGIGKLDYNRYTGTTSAYDLPLATTLSVGAAYMYTMYITKGWYGGPVAWDSSATNNNDIFDKAWGLMTRQDRTRQIGGMGVSDWNTPSYGYGGNSILNGLLSVNSDKSYWLAPYDPDKLYTEIGYFSVFVTNNTYATGGTMASMLFLANMIPEPETYAMMLAGLGLIGVIARRRRSKS